MKDYATKLLAESEDLREFERKVENAVASSRVLRILIITSATVSCAYGVLDRWWEVGDYSTQARIEITVHVLAVLFGTGVLLYDLSFERRLRRTLTGELWRALGEGASPSSARTNSEEEFEEYDH